RTTPRPSSRCRSSYYSRAYFEPGAVVARWAIQESFQSAKGEVGQDHYQVRRYDSWYRAGGQESRHQAHGVRTEHRGERRRTQVQSQLVDEQQGTLVPKATANSATHTRRQDRAATSARRGGQDRLQRRSGPHVGQCLVRLASVRS
ncbi:MAG TPA: hypothetical protein VIJ07_17500, partial [Dermatophilaceae bacterium]